MTSAIARPTFYEGEILPAADLGATVDYAREVLVVERATRSPDPCWPEGLLPAVARRYGDTTLWYGWRS